MLYSCYDEVKEFMMGSNYLTLDEVTAKVEEFKEVLDEYYKDTYDGDSYLQDDYMRLSNIEGAIEEYDYYLTEFYKDYLE